MSSNSAVTSALRKIFAFGTLDTGGNYFSFLVAAVFHYWRSLAINDSRLGSSLTVLPQKEVPSLSSDGPSNPHAIFPGEALILEASANTDIDFSILPYSERLDSFTDGHFMKLGIHKDAPMAERLLISEARRHLVYENEYAEGHPVEAVSVVEYALGSDSEPVPIQEPKRSGTLLYPTLTDVAISGIPVS
ncbi:hypothetical protein IW261DRAFT_1608785 [Armillaria novae-zelandiae]|uniref:Uncharacterized protein n=1 Tax=Armillaria novae-zelandiae TaxID=153914 RepID=A0AA39P5T2_9AGAR|nr:hypothetical protein IW261DRAFT_1608785 [Armillaria novae-zelandiae]